MTMPPKTSMAKIRILTGLIVLLFAAKPHNKNNGIIQTIVFYGRDYGKSSELSP